MELANTEPTFDVHAPERVVFVTDDNRRARRLRRGTFAVASLAVLWLVGLGVGMFGLGGLPGISLGKQSQHGGQAQPEPNSAAKLSPIARTIAPSQSRGRVGNRSRPIQHRVGSQSHSVGNPARPATPVTPPAAGGAPQQPVNPAQRQRGWARKGNPAPPGQVRQAQPKPPAGSRGQRRGQTTTTTTTTTTPLPPGQAKKAPPPPPPPSGG